MTDNVVQMPGSSGKGRRGRKAVGDAVGAALTPRPPEVPNEGTCPVRALGTDDGSYYFLSPSGERRLVKVRDFSANGIASLFDGRIEWLVEGFPAYDKDGNVKPGSFSPPSAARYLMQRCHAAGIWDPRNKLRGLGVWRAPGQAGAPIVHCGDAVWSLEGKGPRSDPPGLRVGRDIYVARPPIEPPDWDHPATDAEVRQVLDAFGLWTWGDRHGRRRFGGWLGQALLGAVSPFRVHGQVAAAFGAGKTTLLAYVAALLGPQAEEWNDYSEAGLRNALANESRVALLDEAEGSIGGGHRMVRVIELIRRMSSGQGAATVRGSPDQQARSSHVTGCALMAAINPPPLEPQDRSRIARFDLMKRTSAPGALGRVEAAIAQAQALSGRLRARVLLRWRLFLDARDAWREALIEGGCDARQADKIAGLLAGEDVLLHEAPPDGDTIASTIEDMREEIADIRTTDAEDGDAERCWAHLLGQVPQMWRGVDRQWTVGEMLAAAMIDRDSPHLSRLPRLGLRFLDVSGQRVALLVANRHPGLEDLFRGSKWSMGGWQSSLSRLGDGDVRQYELPMQFGGPKSRCLYIPAVLLPADERRRGEGYDDTA